MPQRRQTNRPQPRKPDYLRESFDLKKLLELSEAGKNVDITNRNAFDNVMEEEHLPRDLAPVPEKQIGSSEHPLKRKPRDNSMMFLASSEGEDGTLKTKKVPFIHFIFTANFVVINP